MSRAESRQWHETTAESHRPRHAVYGPVASWRLGRSLGLDPISTERKTCSFDCVYCQLGHSSGQETRRHDFISVACIYQELSSLKGISADFVTLSGTGEPTLAANLGAVIRLAKEMLGLPVAVLTNSSLMSDRDVRRDLGYADVVVVKLDAPNEAIFRSINRPAEGIRFARVVAGIKQFRQEYGGRLALQIMFVGLNQAHAAQMAEVAASLSPDEVQLNTPLRPCAAVPLLPAAMATIRDAFSCVDARVTMVYEAASPTVTPINVPETIRRRPGPEQQ
jgi:wyosine [tRNA(Phe)-imidazoG37] synthetase (radical SAM superfamily)